MGMFDNMEMMRLFKLDKVRPENKMGSVELVRTIIKLALKAKRAGILAIEKDVSQENEKPGIVDMENTTVKDFFLNMSFVPSF